MINESPGIARGEVDFLALIGRMKFQQPRIAENAVRILNMIDRHNRVLAGDDVERGLAILFRDLFVSGVDPGDEFPKNAIKLGERSASACGLSGPYFARRNPGAESTRNKIGMPLFGGGHKRFGNPFGRLDVANGPQKCLSGKCHAYRGACRTSRADECSTRATRCHRDYGSGRCANEFSFAAFAEQRKPNGRDDARIVLTEDVPDLRHLDDFVPSGPHFDFVLVSPVEPVGRNAVFARQLAGGHVHLTGQVTQENLAPMGRGRRF